MSDDWSSSDAQGVGGGLGADADASPAGADGFSETTSRSWFDRIKGALAGLLIGLVCIPGACTLLFWNEGRAVQTAQSLTEGAGAVQEVSTPDRVDPALEGRLIHLSAPLRVGGPPLRDPEFGVQAPDGALRLVRMVEMYQWREERHSETRNKLGGGQETVTTYSYHRDWSSTAIDSSRFRQPDGHHNPPMRLAGRTLSPAEARLGAFRLTDEQLARIGSAQPLPVESGSIALRPGTQVMDGRILVGADPGAAPRIGDLRVSYQVARAEAASVVAAQRGDGFAPYQTRAGDRLEMLAAGLVPAAEMIRQAEEGNVILTWILRAVGAVVMFIGFSMILRPVVVLADVIPFLGSIVGFGTGLVGLLLTAVLAPVVIAVAWFWYRPVVAVAVLAAGAAVVIGLGRMMRGRRTARLAAAGALPGAMMAGPQGAAAMAAPPPPPGGRSSFFSGMPPRS